MPLLQQQHNDSSSSSSVSLLAGKQRRTKTVTCASPACEVVAIGRADFLRLMEKSRVVYESMQKVRIAQLRSQPD